jgi:LuxR family maltose regulon positive regulatory protein
MRCEAAVALGGAYWSRGDVVASQRAFSQARSTALKSGTSVMAVPSSCYVAEQQTKRGQLQAAADTYREALGWATTPNGRRLPVAGFPLIKLGDLAREWNDLDAACRDLQQGVALCRQLGQADVLAEGLVMWARLCLAQGDADGARTALKEVEQITRQISIDPWIATWADECRVRMWLSSGELEAALDWVDERGLTPDGAFNYQHDLPHILLARVLLAADATSQPRHSLDEILDLLDRLAEATAQAGWIHEQIQVLTLRALALQRRDAKSPQHRTGMALALDALSLALNLGEPSGYLRAFLDHGAPMLPLLREAAAQGVQLAYVERLLAAAAEIAPACPAELEPRAETTALQPLLEPLSAREIEVLTLIAQGLSNREVGERLYISPGTVKAHTSNIFGKLGVRRRTQAVARARALDILK